MSAIAWLRQSSAELASAVEFRYREGYDSAVRRLSNRGGCLVFIAYLFVPGLILAYVLHSYSWILIGAALMVGLMLTIAALPIKRKITPQQWADELEKH